MLELLGKSIFKMSGVKLIGSIYGALSIPTIYSWITCNNRNISSNDYEMNPIYYNMYFILKGTFNGIFWPLLATKWRRDALHAHQSPEDKRRFMENFTPKIYGKEYYQTHAFHYPYWLKLDESFRP